MAALRKLTNMFSQSEVQSENIDPKSAFAAAGKRTALSEINHPAKLGKFAGKEALPRQPLAAKSVNVPAAAESKLPVKKASIASISSIAHVKAAPVMVMDTKEDAVDLLHVDMPDAHVEDIDVDDDPQLAAEYAKEIYQYMRELEVWCNACIPWCHMLIILHRCGTR